MGDLIFPGGAGFGAFGGSAALQAPGVPLTAIVSERGDPVADESIVRRLRQIDDRLGMSWVRGSPILGIAGHWAVTLRWRPTDRRYAMIQRGELREGTDFDLIGDLPPDCAASEVPAWFEARVRRFSGDASEIGYLLGRVQHWNDAQEQKNDAAVVELAEELFETNARSIAADLEAHGVQAPTAPIVHFVGANPERDRHGKGKQKDRRDYEAFVRDGGDAGDISR